MQDVVIESCRTGVVIVGGVSITLILKGETHRAIILIVFIRLGARSVPAKGLDPSF